jgi:hypothetical protein
VTEKEVVARVEQMRRDHPEFLIARRDYENVMEESFYPTGRAGTDAFVKKYSRFMDKEFEPQKALGIYKNGKRYSMDLFSVDARGNVIPEITDYKTGDKRNFGNVLVKPVSDIIIENSIMV